MAALPGMPHHGLDMPGLLYSHVFQAALEVSTSGDVSDNLDGTEKYFFLIQWYYIHVYFSKIHFQIYFNFKKKFQM